MIFTMKVLLIVFYFVQHVFTPTGFGIKFQGYFELKNIN